LGEGGDLRRNGKNRVKKEKKGNEFENLPNIREIGKRLGKKAEKIV